MIPQAVPAIFPGPPAPGARAEVFAGSMGASWVTGRQGVTRPPGPDNGAYLQVAPGKGALTFGSILEMT